MKSPVELLKVKPAARGPLMRQRNPDFLELRAQSDGAHRAFQGLGNISMRKPESLLPFGKFQERGDQFRHPIHGGPNLIVQSFPVRGIQVDFRLEFRIGEDGGEGMAQVVGIATLLGFVLPLSYGLNWLLDRVYRQRVAREGELQGMDLFELGAGAYPELDIHGDEFLQR